MFYRIYIYGHCNFIGSVFFVFLHSKKKEAEQTVGTGIWEYKKLRIKLDWEIVHICLG